MPYLSDPETGIAEMSQNEMCSEPGAGKPTVNRGFKEPARVRTRPGPGRWPLPTPPAADRGKVSSPVMPGPEIKAAEPERFTEQRRGRYAAQMANLAATG
ncbi:hypothetical protein ACWDE9_07900 [Streptomyces olivaceoviridis]